MSKTDKSPLEHYRLAEKSLAMYDAIMEANPYGVQEGVARGLDHLLLRAQAHATLATVNVTELG